MKSARGRGIGFIRSDESDERGAGADGESQPRRQGKTCVFAKKQKPAAPRHLSGAVVLVRHVLDDHHPGIKPVQSARHRGVVTETARFQNKKRAKTIRRRAKREKKIRDSRRTGDAFT